MSYSKPPEGELQKKLTPEQAAADRLEALPPIGITADPLGGVECAAIAAEVASLVGHELRNNLSSIRNATYYLRSRTEGTAAWAENPRVPQFFELIDDAVTSSMVVLKQRLNLKHLFTRRVARVSAQACVARAIACSRVPEAHRPELECGQGDVEDRSSELALAVRCLIENAVEAMGGRPRVTAYAERARCVITVTDAGTGILATDSSLIFEPLHTTNRGTRFYISCVVLFTASSALCGMATSIEHLVLFRVLQGLAGGGLQPSEQAILMDTFPPARRGMAMAVYTVAILVAPVLGPTLGGYITENYSWRWIFYINLPVGLASVVLSSLLLSDPPYLKAQRAARRGQPFRMDFLGLGLLVIGLAALELLLDKGQEYDWFDSPMILWLSAIAAAAPISTIFWELRHPAPIINLRLFGDRNFSAAAVCVFFAFAVLYGSNVLLPQMLQTLMGYSALNAGLVLSPAGFVTMLEMPLIGLLLSRGVDPRKLIIAGLATVGVASLWMSGLNLGVSPGMVISPRNIQTLGAGLMFVPLNLAAYAFIPKEQVNNASGLFSLVRNEGSSIGVAITNTLLQPPYAVPPVPIDRASQPDEPGRVKLADRPFGALGNHGSDPVVARRQGLGMMYRIVQQQAAAVSYLDMFWLFALLSFAVIPLVFLMKRSRSAAGSVAVH